MGCAKPPSGLLRSRRWVLLLSCATVLLSAPRSLAAEKPLPTAPAEKLGLDAEQLSRIDAAVHEAIKKGELPGAVVVVVHRGHIVFRKAYGNRSVEPDTTLMGPTVVFDLASLTKPIATATSIFILLEQGKLRLSDLVSQHVPGKPFQGAKITIAQLLTHTSGLIADNPLADYRDGREKALQRVYQLKPKAEPATQFMYSDVGYIVLGDLVERLSGMPLDRFAHQHVFAPLGMNETGFRPQGKLAERAAPTEKIDGGWRLGEVHDPRSFAMGGVAGHAGLFSTADDLAVYAQMLLEQGEYAGQRILSTASVREMTAARPVPGGDGAWLRTYGWDMSTRFSSNRGDLFAAGKSFGHTGFTGTSIWLDPDSQTAVIFLSNRVHPKGKGNVTRLRGQAATITAAALPNRVPSAARSVPGTLCGIDVLVRDRFASLKTRRVGLITNHTGRDREGRPTIDLLHQAPGVKLVALFSPEHGIRGALDEKVSDSKDKVTGLPIYSLYGERRKPTADTLQGIDTLVFDIQDAGCRFYTYISTLGLCLEAAAEHKIRFVVLDRPNPLGGELVEGPVLEAGRESFVGYHRLPIRHGMTIGELARMFNKERGIGADLQVIPMVRWKRQDLLDRTGLEWVNPSPNLRSLNAALTYPGIGLLETTNISVGRGTERPFEWIGAPWLDGRRLAAVLAEESLPGVRFVPLRLTPSYSTHKGQPCGGMQIIVDDWTRFRPVHTGLAIAATLRRLYPDDWKIERYDRLLGHQRTFEGLSRGAPWRQLERAWQPELEQFLVRRRAFLLYD